MAINAVYREYDVAQRMLEDQIKAPICTGCGKCCRNNTIFAYGLEAANAVSYLLGRHQMYSMQKRIEGWLLERHRECPTYEPLTENKFSFGLDGKIKDEAIALSKIQCPFYEDKRCLLYQCRPLACRAYGVTRTSEACPRPLGFGEILSRHRYIGGELQKELKAEVNATLDMVPRDTWKYGGFFPTLIYSHVWPKKFANMVQNGLIATAKLVMTYPSLAVIWQDQVESMSVLDIKVSV